MDTLRIRRWGRGPLWVRSGAAVVTWVLVAGVLVATAPRAQATAPSPISVLIRGTMSLGPGIAFPLLGSAQDGSWDLEAPSCCVSAPPTFCAALGLDATNPSDCSLTADGLFGAVASVGSVDLGGWCGVSAGRDGTGTLETTRADSTTRTTTLEELGWITTAGSTVPFHGTWNDTDGAGFVVGLLRLSGDGAVTSCTGPSTKSHYDVNGVLALV